jgi:hypothetical protein
MSAPRARQDSVRPAAPDRAFLGGPSTSSLGAAMPRRSRAFSAASLACAFMVGSYAAAEPPSSLEVFVRDDGSCIVLSQDTPCKDVGARLGAAHVPVGATIVVNGSRLTTYEMVGAAMHSLQQAGYTNVQFPSK